ncbi:MAG: glycosyltransferase family 4 protein [Lentisphaerae bacterium]|nr:glycosyltransferase family 4 protein [Lentisphaerota bacterium]
MPARGRIAFVAPRFAEGDTVGGAEILLRRQAERLAAGGRPVDFLATCARSHVTWANELPAGRRRAGNLDVELFPVDRDRDADAFRRALRAIGRGRWRAEHEQTWLRHGPRSEALCRRLAERASEYERVVVGPCPFALTVRAADVVPDRTVLVPCLHDEPFARLAAVRGMFARVRAVMFNTPAERDLAARLYGGGAPRRFVVGIGMAPFPVDPDAFRARHGLAAPYLIYSGRREPGKGTPLLLTYLAVFRARTGRDIGLVLTGAGPVDAPPDLARHVLDAGVLGEADKHAAMAGALAFCHPSRRESLGIVLLEAWLAGTPALVNGRGAVLREQCRRSRGGLWFRGYAEFEEALLTLADNPALRAALAEAGRRFVLRECAWERVEAALLSALAA